MRTRKHVSLETIEKYITRYWTKENPVYIQIEEGVLGYGTFVMTADKCKWMIVQEKYVNAWVSQHTLVLCNKLPKIWEKRIMEAKEEE